MKQDNGNNSTAPFFRTKLWLYFVLFAAIIFSLLWIMQTVSLQEFYDSMMQRNVREAAEEIVSAAGKPGFIETIDRLSLEDSLLIYITDETGKVLYSSDAYKLFFRQPGKPGQGFGKGIPDQHPTDNGWQPGSFRDLPDNFSVFLEKLGASESGSVSYTADDTCVYGTRLVLPEDFDDDDFDDDEDETINAILYAAGTRTAVGAAASIIRTQLIWVIGFSLLIAFLIAWLIARRFAKPINQLTEQAKMLSEDRYEDHFQRGFCRELDELNDSLSQSAEKLAEAHAYQKELLANVSHDLRTPLTMIKGYAEMIRDISWEDEQQRNADTGVIIKEADRMTALVNEILEYSRLQEKDFQAAFTEVDFSALTNSVLDRFEALFARQGGTIIREIEPGCIVRGNPELLERVIYNLVDNASHHTSEQDKSITVAVTRVDEKTRIEVQDHGEGIDPQELPHIWDKYYTSRQRGNQGVSGLGLAIVKQIAAIHNAEIKAESRIGAGSKFSFTL